LCGLFAARSNSLCDGSDKENKKLLAQMVNSGTLVKLNPKLRPNSFVARSPPSDGTSVLYWSLAHVLAVARVEEQTFICSEHKDDAGFTNNWKEPEQIVAIMHSLFEGCMRGRTMYVVPFVMGPLASPFSQV
jgi:phosphoenolpyruvate carboxykinase (GTP)